MHIVLCMYTLYSILIYYIIYINRTRSMYCLIIIFRYIYYILCIYYLYIHIMLVVLVFTYLGGHGWLLHSTDKSLPFGLSPGHRSASTSTPVSRFWQIILDISYPEQNTQEYILIKILCAHCIVNIIILRVVSLFIIKIWYYHNAVRDARCLALF